MPPAPKAIRVAVDVIIEMAGGDIVLIRRRNPPPGWALPGGFVEYGETLEAAAVREPRAPSAGSARARWGEVRPPGGVARLERGARETRRGDGKGGEAPLRGFR